MKGNQIFSNFIRANEEILTLFGNKLKNIFLNIIEVSSNNN